jgi:enoyl-CoA hydratase/carnithine racemase
MSDPYLHEADDRAVRRITLDSPHNRNALSLALTDELAAAFARVASDAQEDRIRAVVLTGTGPTFCAGADLKDDPATTPQRAERMVDLLELVLTCPVPVVVELNGNVRAGGLGILGAADVVVAPSSATFSFSEVRIGVAPAIIAVTLLPMMTPRAAQRYFLTGETFDAAEAERCGLVTMVVPAEEVGPRVQALTDAFRLAAPSALRITRQLLREGAGKEASRESLLAAARLSAEVFASADAREGLRAFAEKRKPSWVVS